MAALAWNLGWTQLRFRMGSGRPKYLNENSHWISKFCTIFKICIRGLLAFIRSPYWNRHTRYMCTFASSPGDLCSLFPTISPFTVEHCLNVAIGSPARQQVIKTSAFPQAILFSAIPHVLFYFTRQKLPNLNFSSSVWWLSCWAQTVSASPREWNWNRI